MILQDLRDCSVPCIGSVSKCVASMDSILDYSQYVISQSGVGHVMVSAAIAQSTMDFSTTPVDDGVVDSPPNKGRDYSP